ncbi:MAG: NAD(P)/FAD-dependent oxidoreductase [Alphaproteobacteria bacterium]|nr:NAD(P)/FAD-dependent oxidoreductase [Alphaproteobacteria bacterium]
MNPTGEYAEAGLATLNARVNRDLVELCRPPANWVAPRNAAGNPVVDVVIVGGGMCGMLAWFALQSAGMRNVRIVDRSPAGFEGPWVTYARMETLRSPKHLTGPAYGMASLTFRAWFEAQFDAKAWDALDKIPRTMWMDYLRWYRNVLNIPVENNVEVRRIEPEGDLLRLELGGEGAREQRLVARKLIMATGREGTGHPNIPAFMEGVPRDLWAHSADDIDFAALEGKRVAVIGVGASAVENAAEAAEAGAAEVRLLARRKTMPTVNKMMGIGSFGFSAGFAALPDEWRWRFMHYSFETQTPAPHGSTRRANRQDAVSFHLGAPVTDVRVDGNALRINIASRRCLPTDFLILGTGFTTDPLARTEFGKIAAEIQLWEDIYTPPEDERDPDLGRFPYLNPDFTFREKTPGTALWLSKVYCFNYGATASLGKISGDIPGISEGAAWLARDLAATLYREDIEAHWQALQDYEKPELQGDEWTESPLPDDDQEDALP